MKTSIPKNVPLMTGYQYDDPYKQNYHKTQQFSVINNTNCEKTNFLRENLDQNLLDALRTSSPMCLTNGQRKAPENDFIPRIQPPWLKYDRKVLRFAGYFQESVVMSNTENFRIRKCLIYYYLEDGTIHVTEPRVENSGIPQGIFIKRQRIQKDLGNFDQFISWEDFDLGINMNFYERVFRINDCDEFTRNFYEDMGKPLKDAEPMALDNFETQKLLKDIKITPPDTREYKEYFEVKLGGGHPNTGLKKHLENDRKVLSFDVLWNDDSLEGGTFYYKLNYFLSNDTVEVKEERKQNSGKDPFPLMLRRGKLPKIPIMTHCPGMTLKKEEYYEPKDMILGNKISVFGRDILLYDCDPFTKSWFKDNLGVDQIPLQFKNEKSKKFHYPVPPYNGYGTPEDSLGSVYNLQPKPPKRDYKKMYQCDQYILRFEARVISKNKEDNNKKFIISFYCGDDNVMVFQCTERNSGIWGGKFLEKSRFKNPITNKYYEQRDFQIGEIIQLNVYQFQLMRADEFTHNYMKERPEIFKEANVDSILDKLKSLACKYENLETFLIDLLKKMDKNENQFIEFEEFSQGLKELDFNLTYQEQYTLFRKLDTNQDWKLDMKELFNALSK